MDPYRMMTRPQRVPPALRQDNADERLTPIGGSTGLVDDGRWAVFCRDRDIKTAELHRLEITHVKLSDLRAVVPGAPSWARAAARRRNSCAVRPSPTSGLPP